MARGGEFVNRLAFDTATAACAVALRRADGEVFERAPHPERMFEQPAHTTELLPAIAQVLQAAGIGFDELDAITVGVGPGAFTGLRIGVSTARAIATARGIPLSGVSSLAALEAAAADADAQILPVIDARRNEFFFRAGGDDAVATPDELLAVATNLDRPLAIGDGAIKLRDALTEAGAGVPAIDDSRHLVSARAMLALGDAAEPQTVDLVVPNYIRAPDAKVSARESWLVGGMKS